MRQLQTVRDVLETYIDHCLAIADQRGYMKDQRDELTQILVVARIDLPDEIKSCPIRPWPPNDSAQQAVGGQSS